MTISELHNQLKRIARSDRFEADEHRLRLYKHRLLAEVNRSEFSRHRVSLPRGERVRLVYLKTIRSFMLHQYAAALAILILVVAIPMSYIAQAAVPGDTLWPVKLTIEKAEVAVARGAAAESRVHLRHVQNRLGELKVVLAKSQSAVDRSKDVSQVVRRLEKDITAAGQNLKITEDEQKETNPNLVIALARDVNTHIDEVVRALEENKQVLVAEATGAGHGAVGDVSSEPTLVSGEGTDEPKGTELVNASTTVVVAPELLTPENKEKRALVDVITEVQLINEYISYSAIASMVDAVERRGGNNRGEVTALLFKKLDEQRAQLESINQAISLVSSDFELHKSEAAEQAERATGYLTLAANLLELDNLSGSLRNFIHAKDSIEVAARLLREVANAGGLKPLIDDEKNEPVSVGRPEAPASPISIQSMETETSTLPLTAANTQTE